MAELLAVVADDEGFGVYMLTFPQIALRKTVVANQRIGQYHYLTGIRWIGQALGVACHCRIKDHFTTDVLMGSKGVTAESGAIIKNQCCFSHFLYNL